MYYTWPLVSTRLRLELTAAACNTQAHIALICILYPDRKVTAHLHHYVYVCKIVLVNMLVIRR